MATTTGLSADQLQAKIDTLKSQGKTESTSKELGKYVDALKVLQPQKYSAATVASAQAKLATSTQPMSTGVTGGMLVPSSGAGSIDLGSMYNQLFNTAEIQNKKNELSTVEAARDTAIGSIQNNPWFSQATRGGKIAAIKSDAERNLTLINNELGRMQTDAQIQYGIKMDQYNINRQAYQDSLNLFNTLVSNGALATANAKDVANLSVQTGIPTSMINSIIESSKTKNLSLQSFDDGTGQYVVAIDPTGAVYNKTYLGPSKSSGGFQSNDFLASIADLVKKNLGIDDSTKTPSVTYPSNFIGPVQSISGLWDY